MVTTKPIDFKFGMNDLSHVLTNWTRHMMSFKTNLQKVHLRNIRQPEIGRNSLTTGAIDFKRGMTAPGLMWSAIQNDKTDSKFHSNKANLLGDHPEK